MQGSQAVFTTQNDRVTKTYTDLEINKLSSVEHELDMFNKFSESKYCPMIHEKLSDGYIMQKYDFSLGSPMGIDENSIRKLLFFSPDVINQLQEIQTDLKKYKIIHRDINPGNLLYSIKDKCLKLIDFYWSAEEGLESISIPGINGIYKEDDHAFTKLENEIQTIKDKINKELILNEEAFNNIGVKYLDGSSVNKGYAYHVLPYLSNIKVHKLNCIEEYRVVKKHIDFPVKKVNDIGCAQGYFVFNMLRDYGANINGWEADPYVNNFLSGLVDIFNLKDYITIDHSFDDTTILSPSDVTIFLNSHMWLHKQLGTERTETLMRNIAATTDIMFFQTAHALSSSMYLVKYLENEIDIISMLKRCGFRDIVRISISTHGKLRYMFKCKGMLSLNID